MAMNIAMMMRFLSGIKTMKNGKPKNQKQRKSSYTLLGIHQDIEIGVCQKTKNKRQKDYGHKYRPFCVCCPDAKFFFDLKRTTNKDVFCRVIYL